MSNFIYFNLVGYAPFIDAKAQELSQEIGLRRQEAFVQYRVAASKSGTFSSGSSRARLLKIAETSIGEYRDELIGASRDFIGSRNFFLKSFSRRKLEAVHIGFLKDFLGRTKEHLNKFLSDSSLEKVRDEIGVMEEETIKRIRLDMALVAAESEKKSGILRIVRYLVPAAIGYLFGVKDP